MHSFNSWCLKLNEFLCYHTTSLRILQLACIGTTGTYATVGCSVKREAFIFLTCLKLNKYFWSSIHAFVHKWSVSWREPYKLGIKPSLHRDFWNPLYIFLYLLYSVDKCIIIYTHVHATDNCGAKRDNHIKISVVSCLGDCNYFQMHSQIFLLYRAWSFSFPYLTRCNDVMLQILNIALYM